ncbi:MAG: AAA family ATPase [Pyramidobacter sp.]|jgi:DNA repair protein RecN (Recombination protein N)
MLNELRLSSVGGTKEADLTFSSGLTAVTGESGAGKSSLVRALELLSGKRGAGSSIRAGDETASAEAFFYVESPMAGLEESLQPQDCSMCLRREISRSGRGKSSIQGQTVPLGLLAETAPRLISIQSQFAQLELLAPDRQLEILDACGSPRLAEVKERLAELFNEVLDIERDLRSGRRRTQEITSKYGAVAEISPYLQRLDLTPESEEKLNADYEAAQSELRRLRDLRGRCRVLSCPETGGIVEELTECLEGIASSIRQEQRDEIATDAQRCLDDLNLLVERLDALAPTEKIDGLEAEIDQLESAIGVIRKCKRLAGKDNFSDLLDYWHQGEKEMQWLQEFARQQEGLKERAEGLKQELVKSAKELHLLRTHAAAELERRVSDNLDSLAMENTAFKVRITETNKLRANGAERVEFMLARNGREIPVAKAASGGELSRILLAIQISLPDDMLPPTLIFDEVEAGLGGQAAYLTGLKLKQLASRVQVILITHEASIAALADRHFLVQRTGNLSSVTAIEGEQRVREIARMLSGSAGAEEALLHAEKLLGLPEKNEENEENK